MKHLVLSFILLFAVLFVCIAQSESYYYDTIGNKITGIIEFAHNGNIFYKENKKSKIITLTPNDNISSCVVGIDSFSILKDSTTSLSVTAKRFVHILENGKIKMYDYSMLYSKTNNKLGKDANPYYYMEKGDKTYKINEIGWMYNFRKVMTELLNDHPELENEYIKKNKLYISNLRFIIKAYNNHFKSATIIKS